MGENLHEHDPKGLIREAYRIDGITAGECRTIFLDWALSVPMGQEMTGHIDNLLLQYAGMHPDHPMTGVLREGQQASPRPKRRGGRSGRRADT
ncbi:MAG: hypothetical protein AAGA08_02835 [Pseudomonadota bacterium]